MATTWKEACAFTMQNLLINLFSFIFMRFDAWFSFEIHIHSDLCAIEIDSHFLPYTRKM